MTELLFRCDASTTIGTGHFFRCLALAEAADRERFCPRILSSELPLGLEEQAEASSISVDAITSPPGSDEDARELSRRAEDAKAAAVVVDGYHFPPDYYRRLSDSFRAVAAIDDIGHQPFPVDLLVNVNPDAEQMDYGVPDHCCRLLGMRFTMLRRQFLQVRREIESDAGVEMPDRVERVLVFLGGGDPGNATAMAVRALARAGYQGQTDVVLGAANPHRDLVVETAGELKGPTRLLTNVTRMAELMREQHLAVCAGGSASWEFACLGVPMVQVVIADNQERISMGLAARGVVEYAGRSEAIGADGLARRISPLLDSKERREVMARRGWELVDGRGARRVTRTLGSLLGRREGRVEQEGARSSKGAGGGVPGG